MDLILQMLYSSQSHLAIVSVHSILLYKHFSKSDAISQKRCKNQGTFTPKYLNCSSLSNSLKINTVTPPAFHSSSKYSKDAKLSALEHGIWQKTRVNYHLEWMEKLRQGVTYPKSPTMAWTKRQERSEMLSQVCVQPLGHTASPTLRWLLSGTSFISINYF